MSNQIYIAAPLHEKTAAHVVAVLEKWVKEHSGENYHKLRGAEKEFVGSRIHDINSAIASLKDAYYKKQWMEFEKFFYPKKK